MITTIDKSHITVADYPKVKSELKEFKARYTDGDLKCFADRAIADKYEKITGNSYPYACDVIRADVQAFDYDDDNGTYFRVDVLVDRYLEIVKIHYYANLDLEVDADAHWNRFENRYMYTFDITRYPRDIKTGHILYSDVAY